MAASVRFTSGVLNLKFTILLGAVLFIWTGTFLLLIPCQPSRLTESRIKPGWIWRNLPSLTDIQLNCPVSQDPEWWQRIKAEFFRRDILTSLILEITPRHHSSVGAPSPVARGGLSPCQAPTFVAASVSLQLPRRCFSDVSVPSPSAGWPFFLMKRIKYRFPVMLNRNMRRTRSSEESGCPCAPRIMETLEVSRWGPR